MKPEEITKYMGAVGEGIKNLALQMKQPAEQVYELFLRQNYVKGVIGILQIVFVGLATWGYLKFIKWGMGKEKDRYSFDLDGVFGPVSIISGILLTTILFIVFFVGFEEVLSRFINPHYMTIKDIIELVKPKK
jgi:hypothetical protein